MNIKLKRAYEEADSSDGIRILVERLWPRGVTKTAAALDHWFKDSCAAAQREDGAGYRAIAAWVKSLKM